MQESIRFIKKLDPDYIDVLLAVPIPNSRLFKEALEEKKIVTMYGKKYQKKIIQSLYMCPMVLR